MKDMLHMGSTLSWGQEVRKGVAAQCVAMEGLECTGIEGHKIQCSLVAFCPRDAVMCTPCGHWGRSGADCEGFKRSL